MRIEVLDRSGATCSPHWHTDGEPDRFGKVNGYRLTPPASSGLQQNIAAHGVYFDTIDDLAAALRILPSWGVRMSAPGKPASIFSKNIQINGEPR